MDDMELSTLQTCKRTILSLNGGFSKFWESEWEVGLVSDTHVYSLYIVYMAEL